LVDNQLPPALARMIQSEFDAEALHVSDIGFRDASDRELWSYASVNQFVLISKDQDFVRLFLTDPVVRLIWVRIANCRRAFLLDLFRRDWPRITGHLESGEQFIEIRSA
jgi:predicted nuclease of predicted toxin-antitoxin system